MPIEYSCGADGGIFLTATGLVTADELFDGMNTLYATPEKISKIRYQLSDFTAVSSWQITTAEIVELAKLDNLAAQINPTMLIAIAADDGLAYGLSRMWEAYLDSSPLKSHVFKTVEECKTWLAPLLD